MEHRKEVETMHARTLRQLVVLAAALSLAAALIALSLGEPVVAGLLTLSAALGSTTAARVRQ